MANVETKISQTRPPAETQRWVDSLNKAKFAVSSNTKIQVASLKNNVKIPGARVEKAIKKEFEPYFPKAKLHEWDDNPKFFEKGLVYKDVILAKGVRIRQDAGMDFYVVQRGDTAPKIRDKLTKFKKYKYLDRPEYRRKKFGFNILTAELEAGMFIPIPVNSRERRLTDEQFANYCQLAIEDMKTDSRYGNKMQNLLDTFSERELVGLMLAVAKQESGGKPLGQFVFHRWEKSYRCFSFSIFHVLMAKNSAGMRAREKLGLTEGQTYHPRNAAKLFLAFIFEKVDIINIIKKTNKQAEDYLPIGIHENQARFVEFARFYNGRGHEKNHYVPKIKRYLNQSHYLFNGRSDQPLEDPKPEERKLLVQQVAIEARTKKKKPSPEQIKIVKGETQTYEIGKNTNNLWQAIRNANWLTREADQHKINHLKNGTNVNLFVKRILKYLRAKFDDDSMTWYASDRIGVGTDKLGTFLIFERGSVRDVLRIPKQKESIKPQPKIIRFGKSPSLFRAVLNANARNSEIIGHNILKTNRNALALAERLQLYLQRTYRKGVCYENDLLAVWQDKHGYYIRFIRNGKKAIIRPRH